MFKGLLNRRVGLVGADRSTEDVVKVNIQEGVAVDFLRQTINNY